jgi:hypothetical protein
LLTECIQETFSFAAHFSRRVEAGFTVGQASSDGGALLLRETDRRINLLGRLAGCFNDGRSPLLITHPLSEMLSQRIYGLALGYEDLNDQSTGKATRIFAEFPYQTRKSWSCSRRVVAKAEYLDKGENPRFVVTSLSAEQWTAQDLYEKFYCARGEMENRIKEPMRLFADRLSSDEMKGNQLRFYFSALAYTLMEALRRLGLRGTEWAQAQVDTIRLKLFKIGTLVRISVRRIVLQMSSAYAWKHIDAQAFHALRC